MDQSKIPQFINHLLDNMPSDWLELTTHRLDVYDEARAKTEFLEKLEELYHADQITTADFIKLPTAYDYIRLGHPLSCVLEWLIARELEIPAEHGIAFSSCITPLLAILRKNHLDNKKTMVYYTQSLPENFDAEIIQSIYGYSFSHKKISDANVPASDGTTVMIAEPKEIYKFQPQDTVDFYIHSHAAVGSILVANGNADYISEIQHVRRRETIAMTPNDCHHVLKQWANGTTMAAKDESADKQAVLNAIGSITQAPTDALVASSGLSIQYAIMMGLIHDAHQNFPNKSVRFLVPPNCYGGTNDQARRVAACLPHVAILDLPVDGDNDMVSSINAVLDRVALEDAVPYIIAEIPTNPRVEVPDLVALKAALAQDRKTAHGETAISPVFILDQTFCPNVNFLGDNAILSGIKAISYASGSKFPSGGKCTAGYCVANAKAASLMPKIEQHLYLCDNEATPLQYAFLAEQLPSMLSRIEGAYLNTRAFVNYIEEVLPAAKINFVSEELAAQGFTPSVFSLDLPTKGSTYEEKEAYKRAKNLELINSMITQIPDESKYCVSYGQLKGCYWTIPATSTQGTTKEGDKDYIARVSCSANMDLEKHKEVFQDFVN